MTLKNIKIFIIDDHSLIRIGLNLILKTQDKFVPIIKEASNGLEAIQILKEDEVDVILLDVTMPEMER